jgi:hypothetical protein
VGRPVADYVRDVPLPVRFGRPVTVLDLVTHAGGYDVRLEGTAAASEEEILPLSRFLRDRMPPQLRRSGELLSYSNHGYTLLGHLIETVSGESFEAYVAAHVFQPLGMSASGFHLTPDVRAKTAVGYQRGADGFHASVVVHPHIYPAAGLNASAEDIARFMVAHLDGGRFGGARILSNTSVEWMHRQQLTAAPGVPGMAFGFFEYPIRGRRALVHGGRIRGFMSGLVLFPERRLGLFVANNGYSDWLVRDLVTDFARRWLGEYARPPERRGPSEQLRLFVGAYRPLSATVGTPEKAGALRNGDMEVGVGFWDRLTVGRTRFVQTDPGAFVSEWGNGAVWLTEHPTSRAPMAVTADPVNGVVWFERVPWYATARCHLEVLLACILVFFSVMASWVLPWRSRELTSGSPPTGRVAAAARAALGARLLLSVIVGMNLLGLALLVGAFRSAEGAGVLFGLPGFARLTLRLNLAAAALGVLLAPAALAVWRAPGWPLRARVHFSVGVLACLAFAAWCWHWQLL